MPGRVIRHYYHLYADGQWREPLAEHLAALETITTPMRVTIGLVGAPPNRAETRAALDGLDVAGWVEADTGWEQVTLDALHADAAHHDDPVLYAHTKGAHDPTEINQVWRRSMTRHVVTGWRACLDLLDQADAVGCHWLGPAQGRPRPHFGGNFWWATSRYLRTLPPPQRHDRWDAEAWIGLNNPTVADLLPGWPSLDLCAAPDPAKAVV